MLKKSRESSANKVVCLRLCTSPLPLRTGRVPVAFPRQAGRGVVDEAVLEVVEDGELVAAHDV